MIWTHLLRQNTVSLFWQIYKSPEREYPAFDFPFPVNVFVIIYLRKIKQVLHSSKKGNIFALRVLKNAYLSYLNLMKHMTTMNEAEDLNDSTNLEIVLNTNYI